MRYPAALIITCSLIITGQKYVLPHLQPPSATAYEADRDALASQFDAAEALLKEIQAESAAVRLAVEQQNEKVEKATRGVEDVVQEIKEGESRTRDEMREIREEVNNVREMLPKVTIFLGGLLTRLTPLTPR